MRVRGRVGCGLRLRRRFSFRRRPIPYAARSTVERVCISVKSVLAHTRTRTAAVLNRSALEALENEPDKRPVFFNRSSATKAMVPLFGA